MTHRQFSAFLGLVVLAVIFPVVAYAWTLPALDVTEPGAVALAIVWAECGIAVCLMLTWTWFHPVTEADKACARIDQELDDERRRRAIDERAARNALRPRTPDVTCLGVSRAPARRQP